jgi:hypothetical protein
MKPYVGVPYVYVSRNREKLESLLESGKALSKKDGLKLSSGDKNFLSFTSEFRHESASDSAIIATLELIDTDRKFEEFFIEDALVINASYGVVYYFAFGIGNGPSPIHAMTLIGLVNRDDNSGLRKIVMRFVTGAGGSPYDYNQKGLQDSKYTTSKDLKVELLAEVTKNVVGSKGRVVTEFNYLYEQSIEKLAARYTEKPVIVLLPSLRHHLERKSASRQFKNWWLKWLSGETLREDLNKTIDYFNSLGFNIVKTKTEEEKFFFRFGAFLGGFEIGTEHVQFLADKENEPMYVTWNDDITKSGISLKAAVTDIFSKMNEKSDYVFELDMVWISDKNVINILAEGESGTDREIRTGEKFLFPSISDRPSPLRAVSEVLVIGDKNTINSVLYGAETNILVKKAIINTETEQPEFDESGNALFKSSEVPLDIKNYTTKGMHKLLWEYHSKVLRPTKNDSIFRAFFNHDKEVKTFIENALDTTGHGHALDDMLSTIPLLKYNEKNSNILNMTVQKDNQFFATLLSIYSNLSKAKEDLTDILEPFLVSNKVTPNTNTNSLNGDEIKNRVLELYILAKYNSQLFTVRVKTLPLFTFSSPAIVGTGLMGMIGNGLKISGKYNLEPSPLDRIYTGLWNIFGYKHVISSREVYSEFTLIRKNANMFNSGFVQGQFKEQEDARLKREEEELKEKLSKRFKPLGGGAGGSPGHPIPTIP